MSLSCRPHREVRRRLRRLLGGGAGMSPSRVRHRLCGGRRVPCPALQRRHRRLGHGRPLPSSCRGRSQPSSDQTRRRGERCTAGARPGGGRPATSCPGIRGGHRRGAARAVHHAGRRPGGRRDHRRGGVGALHSRRRAGPPRRPRRARPWAGRRRKPRTRKCPDRTVVRGDEAIGEVPAAPRRRFRSSSGTGDGGARAGRRTQRGRTAGAAAMTTPAGTNPASRGAQTTASPPCGRRSPWRPWSPCGLDARAGRGRRRLHRDALDWPRCRNRPCCSGRDRGVGQAAQVATGTGGRLVLYRVRGGVAEVEVEVALRITVLGGVPARSRARAGAGPPLLPPSTLGDIRVIPDSAFRAS